jgi:hypothetical protein
LSFQDTEKVADLKLKREVEFLLLVRFCAVLFLFGNPSHF